MPIPESVSGSLHHAFTAAYPLGPEASPEDRRLLAELYIASTKPHRDTGQRDPAFILGRKGAGKTALLLGPLAGEVGARSLIQLTDDGVYGLMKKIEDAHAKTYGQTFASQAASIWLSAFWHLVIVHLVYRQKLERDPAERDWNTLRKYVSGVSPRAEFDPDQTIRDFLVSVLQAIPNADIRYDVIKLLASIGPLEANLGSATAAAKRCLQPHPRGEVFIAIDSLEDLQYKDAPLEPVIRGLFKAVGKNAAIRDPFFKVRCCFPAEQYRRMGDMSVNPDKDFTKRYLLQWIAPELIMMLAVRYRYYLKVRHPSAYISQPGLANLDLRSPDGAKRFVQSVLPTEDNFKNRLDEVEEPIAYILRHTQLLPRQFIQVFAAITSKHDESNGDPLKISQESIVLVSVRYVSDGHSWSPSARMDRA